MATTSRYGNTNQKKNCPGSGRKAGRPYAITRLASTGTELTVTRAARSARRGRVGTTTVNSTVHTATHESPAARAWRSTSGSVYSATAMP